MTATTAASAPVAGETPQRTRLGGEAYQILRRKIMRRELSPGSQITLDALAEQLQISRTPLRDALQELVRDGLVEVGRNGRHYVTELAAEDVEEIFSVRRVLEGLAARRAATRLAARPLQRLREGFTAAEQALTAGDLGPLVHADERLHDVVARASGNGRLVRMIEALDAQIHWDRHHPYAGSDPHVLLREHLDILASLEAKDADRADAAMQYHIRQAEQRILQKMEPRCDRAPQRPSAT